jgi:hypothetical protein
MQYAPTRHRFACLFMCSVARASEFPGSRISSRMSLDKPYASFTLLFAEWRERAV